MKSSAQPASRNARIIRNNSAHSREDNDAVGSSKMSTRDSWVSARAICITCFCAMLRRPAGASASKSAPSSRSTVVARVRIAAQCTRPPLGRLRIDEQVFRDRKVVERQAFLVHHADAQRARRLRRGDAHRIAIDADFTSVGLIDARQDLYQRGFSGAVLADQRGNRAPPQFETRALEGSDTAE